MITTKDVVRSLTPPIVWRGLARLKPVSHQAAREFEGPFPSWTAACARADGWDAQAITDKTVAAARRVRDGEVEVEQDGLARDRIPYSPTILSFLCLVLSRHRKIDIIDFGGGLGSNYYQNRKILRAAGLPVRWTVVERPALVDVGRAEFQTNELRFARTLADADTSCDALVFTGSFQYLESPETTLDEIAPRIGTLAFDRLLVSDGPVDAAYVQHPNPTLLYPATYPVRCFSKGLFIERVKHRGMTLVESFPGHAEGNFDHCGFVFTRSH